MSRIAVFAPAVTLALNATLSLTRTIKGYNERDRTLRRLLDQLDALNHILDTLLQVLSQEDSPILVLLVSPVDRCRQLCQQFEVVMNEFTQKPFPGYRDWAKMEFMKGDINRFISTVSVYQSTISVGLGTVMFQIFKATPGVLKLREMVKDAEYDLKVQLQHINDMIDQSPSDDRDTTSMHFRDERTVTRQCIHICEEADQVTADAMSVRPEHLEAHEETSALPGDNRDAIPEFIRLLQLNSLSTGNHPDSKRVKAQSNEDIKALNDSLELCNIAGTVASRRGEIVAEGESSQDVVANLKDLFDPNKIQAILNRR